MVLCLVMLTGSGRSSKSKSAVLLTMSHMISSEADLFAVTETWLTPQGVAGKLEIVSPLGCPVHSLVPDMYRPQLSPATLR